MARTGNKSIQAKLVLLGDMGTGKTSLVLRFVKGQFYDYQESTIGAAFFTQVLSLNEATIKFDIWDTAGQERYHSLAPMYYRGAAAAVVAYDITSTDSFEKAKKWVREVKRQGNPNLVMVLVANKADLNTNRKVENELSQPLPLVALNAPIPGTSIGNNRAAPPLPPAAMAAPTMGRDAVPHAAKFFGRKGITLTSATRGMPGEEKLSAPQLTLLRLSMPLALLMGPSLVIGTWTQGLQPT